MKLIVGVCILFVAVLAVSASDEGNQRQTRGADERKYRYDQDKKDVSNFLNTKNLIRTVVKLLFGNSEESSATSRQVLNVLVKVLDMVRTSFGQRARSAGSGRGIRDTFDDAAVATVTMVRGYVKSVLSKDGQCAQKHLCEASKEATRDGRELGSLVAQFGGYASSYLLDKQHGKVSPFNKSYDAVRLGRNGDDCSKIFQACNETD